MASEAFRPACTSNPTTRRSSVMVVVMLVVMLAFMVVVTLWGSPGFVDIPGSVLAHEGLTHGKTQAT